MALPGQTSLGTIRATVRQRTDKVNSQFVTDAELNGWINTSTQELYDLLIGAYGEEYFFTVPYFITTDGSNDKYNLPDGSATYTLPLATGGAAPVSVIAASPNGLVQSGNTVTVTTNAAHQLQVNQFVNLANAGVSTYNGVYQVIAIPS